MIDILQNKVLGPLVLEQIELGLQAASESVRQEGRQEGLRLLFCRLAEKRFGPLPAWAQVSLANASPETLIQWTLALNEADSLEALFRQ